METAASTVILKPIAQTEKCFLDENIASKAAYRQASMLRGERFSLQLAYQDTQIRYNKRIGFLKVQGEIADWVTLQRVENVPVAFPVTRACKDTNFLRREPGLYPDLLRPITEENRIYITSDLQSVWIDIRVPKDAPAGDHVLRFTLYDGDEIFGTCFFTVHVIPAVLPPQKLTVTQWFYCDCLATYYNVEMFSERHWQIIENFLRTAVDNGVNMILTPILTPALDTRVGGERPTNQLVTVTRINGKWSFDFTLVHRWITMCKNCGVEYFEISHLFTQWGAAHAPKVMATVDGEYKKVFGWETDACDPEYTAFLHALLPQLIDVLKSHGIEDKTVFHISDEPNGQGLASYLNAKNSVSDVLAGHTVMDAMSDYSFYAQGHIQRPVVATDHVEPFLENNVQDLWVYYCCTQIEKVSNRMIAMSTARNRIIATQLYKYRIQGFLHWGYNFYFTQHSCEPCNPYSCNDGGFWAPAGDTFSVYPAPDGTAYESIHLLGFTAALNDLRAMELAEDLCGRDAVMDLLEKDIAPITFSEYPHDQEYILDMRERLNKLIAAHI